MSAPLRSVWLVEPKLCTSGGGTQGGVETNHSPSGCAHPTACSHPAKLGGLLTHLKLIARINLRGTKAVEETKRRQ